MFLERARVLVIDDEEVMRDSCTQALVKEGYIVRSAKDGDSGLKLFREFKPDLVLIDLKMPGKSGIEVLEETGMVDENVVRIVITGYGTVASAVDAMKKGAYDFIPKPFTPEEIRMIVSRGVEKRRLLLETETLRIEQERIRRHMISLVSHELRAPLAATVQYLEIILGGMAGEISAESTEMIQRCDVRLREMLELLGRWLSLATFDPAKMADRFLDIDLSHIAGESIEVLKPLAEEKGINLILEVPEDLPSIKGVRVTLGEIFNNLVGNAIKYNRPGGRVKVSLGARDEEVWAEISDNGVGIEEKHLPRIFDEFYRVDGRRNAPIKGSGLGLSIVRKMVDVNGGLIDVESRPGQGTTFRISFPKVFEPQSERE
jgi:two-component system sensor histidine kinase/response regulator